MWNKINKRACGWRYGCCAASSGIAPFARHRELSTVTLVKLNTTLTIGVCCVLGCHLCSLVSCHSCKVHPCVAVGPDTGDKRTYHGGRRCGLCCPTADGGHLARSGVGGRCQNQARRSEYGGPRSVMGDVTHGVMQLVSSALGAGYYPELRRSQDMESDLLRH